MFYYHPVYDPLNKLLRPLIDPNLLTLGQTPPWEGQDPATPPLIDQLELQKLALEGALLQRSPELVSLSDLCEGNVSIHNFALIVPRLPWDQPDLRPPPHLVHSKEVRGRHGVWSTRLSLMKCLSPSLGSSSGSSSESQSSQESPLPFPSLAPVSLVNMFGAQSLREPRRLHKRKPSPRWDSAPAMPISEEGEGAGLVEGIHTPPDINLTTEEEDPCSSLSSSSSHAPVPPPLGTCSPPSGRFSPSHSEEEITVLSPDVDRLGSILEEEGACLDEEQRREQQQKGGEGSPVQRKRRRRTPAGDVVALPLAKGKNQKTIFVASIKSFFR
jgi:hypothetical protein